MPSVRARSSCQQHRMRRRVACRPPTRQTRGGRAAGSAGISQEPVVRAAKAPSPTEGHRRVLSSRHGILCEERTGGVRRRRTPITAEKTTRGVERGEMLARAFQTRRSRAKAISAHPGPGGVAGIKGDVRRLRVRTWHVVRAPRRIPRANSGRSEQLAGGSCGAVCGAVWSSVEKCGRIFSCLFVMSWLEFWPAHPTDTSADFCVNLSQQFFAIRPHKISGSHKISGRLLGKNFHRVVQIRTASG